MIEATEIVSPDGMLYLDHAGTTLPPKSMLKEHLNELSTTSLGNPHSRGIQGNSTETMIDHARNLVCNHFGVKDREYDVIFVSNATAAIKLVGEIFPWSSGSSFLHPYNCHTSLLGIRSMCNNIVCFPSSCLQLSDSNALMPNIESELSSAVTWSLLGVPGECNFSGTKYNQDAVKSCLHAGVRGITQQFGRVTKLDKCHDNDLTSNNSLMWLLDASKLAATSSLMLSDLECKPHFVCVSFYKMFGYPTGIAALLIRRDVAPLLRKSYFGGGTVAAVAADRLFTVSRLTGELHELLEDGTPNYHGISAIKHGLSALSDMGGMTSIQRHTYALALATARRLAQLKHAVTGQGVAVVYGRWQHPFVSSVLQGTAVEHMTRSIVTFNLCWADGQMVGFGHVGRVAEMSHIALRVGEGANVDMATITILIGCFCNSGACQESLQLSAQDIVDNHRSGRTCGDDNNDIVNGRVTGGSECCCVMSCAELSCGVSGAVRVSFGFSSTQEDCDALFNFISKNFVDQLGPFSSSLPPPCDALSSSCQRVHDQTNTEHFNSKACADTQTDPLPLSLSRILLYPVKSCRGVTARVWPLCSSGLHLDREWLIADRVTGRALTQKLLPQLALIAPSLDLRRGTMTLTSLIKNQATSDNLDISNSITIDITLEQSPSSVSPSLSSLSCAYSPMSSFASGAGVTVTLCGRKSSGVQTGAAVSDWLSTILGVPCVLVRRSQVVSDSKSFANDSAFLLLSEESVSSLNQVMSSAADPDKSAVDQPVDVSRFRPNLVVQGGSGLPHQEDNWSNVTLSCSLVTMSECLQLCYDNAWDHYNYDNDSDNYGHTCCVEDSALSDMNNNCKNSKNGTSDSNSLCSHGSTAPDVQLQVTGACARCCMVDVNGNTGTIDNKVLRVLGSYRRKGSQINFGQLLGYSPLTVSLLAACTTPRTHAQQSDDHSCDDTHSNQHCIVLTTNSIIKYDLLPAT